MIVNRSELASILGVNLSTLDNYVRKGMPVLKNGQRGVPNEFDSADCIYWYTLKHIKESIQK